MTHTYNVSGMTCTGCQTKVQDLLSKLAGVKNVTVDLAKGTTEIEMVKHISAGELKAALGAYPKYRLSEISGEEKKSLAETYKPILLIFSYVTAISIIASLSSAHFIMSEAMRVFMAGFFISFSFFKMLDLKGFADSYSTYDILAKKFRHWAFIYAFIELFLGLAYAANFRLDIINYITLVVMSVSIIGVLQSVLNKRKIKCGCLGTVFNLPMSTVTIFEDSLMIAMSTLMITVL
jgi:copper chaperone CopZ